MRLKWGFLFPGEPQNLTIIIFRSERITTTAFGQGRHGSDCDVTLAELLQPCLLITEVIIKQKIKISISLMGHQRCFILQ